jgi:hypothetical protein
VVASELKDLRDLLVGWDFKGHRELKAFKVQLAVGQALRELRVYKEPQDCKDFKGRTVSVV